MKRRGIIHMDSGGQQEDRISNLPDEIIHEILACLRSPPEPAKLAILSKRWNHLWLSYPVLEFNHRRIENGKKFSDLQHVAVVRINLSENYDKPSDLLEKLLGFVSTVTQEVELESVDYIVLPRGLINHDRFRNLKVVKLHYVSFPSGSSVRFGPSLQVLCLTYIRFPFQDNEGDRMLSSMIDGASYLETLTLKFIFGVERLWIRGCSNLKTLKLGYFGDCEISGPAQSLEFLHVGYLSKDQISLTPNNNVKVLHIRSGMTIGNEDLNEFISKFPRLESLEFDGHPCTHELLKIDANNHKLLRSIWFSNQHYESWPEVIEIDAPRLSNLIIDTVLRFGFPRILINGCDEAASYKQVSVLCRLAFDHYGIDWYKLDQLLAKLSRFRLTLEFTGGYTGSFAWIGDAEEGSNVPVIEHVKFSLDLLDMDDPKAFVISLLRCCRPKKLSFSRTGKHKEVPKMHTLLVKNLCDEFNIIL